MGTHEMKTRHRYSGTKRVLKKAIGNSRKGNHSFFRLSEVRPNHSRLRISARFSETWLDVVPEPEVTVWSFRTHDLFNERTKP